jgi:hypothetical protein
MMLRTLAVAAFACAQSCAFAQQGSHVGAWAGTMVGNGGRDVPLEVKLEETSGTWRMSASGAGAGGKHNPCFGKDMPVAVERKDDNVLLDVHGGKVVQGCMDQRATLTLSGNRMTGALADGRSVSLTKK